MKIIRDRLKSVDLDEFLSRPLFAHLATMSEFGPRESPVWFLWEEESLWMIGNRRTDTFPIRIQEEPRCAIGVVEFDHVRGLVRHVGFRGRATVEPFDKERAKRIFRRYLGQREEEWDVARFIAPLDDPDNVLVRFDPETAVARDLSYPPSPSLKG